MSGREHDRLRPDESDLLDQLPSCVIAADYTGTIVYVNEEAARLLDYDDPGDLVGQPLVTLMPQEMIPRHQEGFDRYRRTGRSGLLGKRLRVPALTSKREEKKIDLRIRLFRRPDGTDLIVGALAPAGDKPAVDLSVEQIESDLLARMYRLI